MSINSTSSKDERIHQKMSPWILNHLWLIPAVPFAASLMILSLSNPRRRSAAALAVAGQVAALALSLRLSKRSARLGDNGVELG